jgi:hypothetical protein
MTENKPDFSQSLWTLVQTHSCDLATGGREESEKTETDGEAKADALLNLGDRIWHGWNGETRWNILSWCHSELLSKRHKCQRFSVVQILASRRTWWLLRWVWNSFAWISSLLVCFTNLPDITLDMETGRNWCPVGRWAFIMGFFMCSKIGYATKIGHQWISYILQVGKTWSLVLYPAPTIWGLIDKAC